ncbi:MAG: acyl-CoA dehydrogenase family protein [Porticoccaceae bacterium]
MQNSDTASLKASISPFTETEEMFRSTVRKFLDQELEPNWMNFEKDGGVSRSFWRKAGEAGILGLSIPEDFGGAGADGIMYVVLSHELGKSIGGATIGTTLDADLASLILVNGGSEEQLRTWAPGILSGEVLQSLALTEPDAGSDATAIRTTAVRDGNEFIINGSKTYITNANKADLIYVVAKTDATQRASGMSIILVDGNTTGITRRKLKTMGYSASDVAELHFDNVRVPATNLISGEGKAMALMLSFFALDRLGISARALGEAELAFSMTLDYVKQRQAFGQRIFDFQNTQFKLADMKTQLEVGRSFLHDGVRKLRLGCFELSDGAMLKLWVCEMAGRVIDECVQLFGGAGFMDEMPISRLYKGNRLHRIYAGTSELQKVAIARTL